MSCSEPQAVSVQELAAEEPRHGLQADVGVRGDVDRVTRIERLGPHVIGEAPRPDHPTTSRGKGSTNLELAHVSQATLQDVDARCGAATRHLTHFVTSFARSTTHPRRRCPTGSPAVVGRLERGTLDLRHLEHRATHPARSRVIGAAHQRTEQRGDDLPRESEAVLQPPALAGLAALDEAAQ